MPEQSIISRCRACHAVKLAKTKKKDDVWIKSLQDRRFEWLWVLKLSTPTRFFLVKLRGTPRTNEEFNVRLRHTASKSCVNRINNDDELGVQLQDNGASGRVIWTE